VTDNDIVSRCRRAARRERTMPRRKRPRRRLKKRKGREVITIERIVIVALSMLFRPAEGGRRKAEGGTKKPDKTGPGVDDQGEAEIVG